MKNTSGSQTPNTLSSEETEQAPYSTILPAWMNKAFVESRMHANLAPVYAGLREKPIAYVDPAPRPFITQISLVEYFERMTRWKADPWQVDLCSRLQAAAEGRDIKGVRQVYHAEPQIGKTIIISQHLPAWLLGHDPKHRVVLAMYNTAQSEKHSKEVIRILSSPLHKEIFPDQAGWLAGDHGKQPAGRPVQAAVSGWRTNAGRGSVDSPGNAGQLSFNPVGLVSGLTGSGFDSLIIDDPYRSEKDAFSPTVNEAIRNFLDFLESRINLNANLWMMFHRYAFDDAAAYVLDQGDVEYIRYATECDGPYLHASTGALFADPLNREIGELISPRRGLDYYAKVKKNKRVWSSMNQGRPVAAGNKFFDVDRIEILPAAKAMQRKAECTVLVRAWDLGATEEAGDYSVAALVGMGHEARPTVFEMERKQVDSAGRDELMLSTAQRDGFGVVVSVPQDPGAAGKTAVFHIQQLLKGYTVAVRTTSGSKEDRARPLASSMGSGEVTFVDDAALPEEKQWIEPTKKEMREFLLSALVHDDTIDSIADGYNECFERISKGLIIKNYKPQNNLAGWHQFAVSMTNNGKPLDKLPDNWTVYVGAKITPAENEANSAVVVARAAQNTDLDDTLFVVAEYKAFDADLDALFTWIDVALDSYCSNPEDATIWLHPDSEQYKQVIWQKLQRSVTLFEGGETAGLSELDWYLGTRTGKQSPFNENLPATGIYGLVADPAQMSVATDEYGLYSMRQEFTTWGFDESGNPTKVGAVLDCLRMVCFGFRTIAADLSKSEKIERSLTPAIRADALADLKETDPGEYDRRLTRRMIEIEKAAKEVDNPTIGPSRSRFSRR